MKQNLSLKLTILSMLLVATIPVLTNGQCIIPTISTSGPTSFCEGGQVVLTANSGSDTWTKKSDFVGAARAAAISFTIGNKGYLGLGRSFSFPYPKYTDFWAYDPGADTWTQKADFPGGARETPVGFAVGSKGYVGIGLISSPTGPSTYLKDFWEFDPAANTWIKKADFGGAGRQSAAAFNIGDKGYISCGRDQNDVLLNDLWEYDPPSDQWIQKASVGNIGRIGAVAFSIAGKGYLGMGSFVTGNVANPLKDFWEYNQATNTWFQKADFRGGNSYSTNASFSIKDKGYVSNLESYFKNDLWQYDPAFDAWVLKKSFPGSSREAFAGFSVGGKGYLGTGRSSAGNLKDFWEYKPEDDFTYLWSTGETTPSIIVKTNGSFNVTVSNSGGCSATSAFTDVRVGTSFPAPMILADGPTTFCEGKNVTLSVNNFWENDPGGSTSLDYTYLWSTGETTLSIVASTAGIYTLRVTNATGCSQVTNPVEVKVASSSLPPHIDAYGKTRVCEGSTIPVTAIPGYNDPAIQFLWSTGETTQTINSGGGILTVTTIDQNGCTATSQEFDLFAEPLPTVEVNDYQHPDCSGANSGFINPTAIGYTFYFAYTIDNWATLNYTGMFPDLGPGTYLIGVESQTGCRSAIYPFTLSRVPSSQLEIICPPPLVVTKNRACGAVDIELGAPSATGGCQPITITSSYPGATFPVGTTIITWTATDFFGGTVTCQQLVTVLTQTETNLTCPPDRMVQPTSLLGAIVIFSPPEPTNNCPGTTVTQTAGPSSGSMFPIGVTQVTFSERNAAGNTVTCSFQVKVLDPFCSRKENKSKVYVCHKGQTICVSVNALAAHLGHGDKIGQCNNDHTKPANQVSSGISVFPNPTKGQFTVQLNNMPPSDASLLILDAKGSIIENRSVKKAAFSPTISVNLGNRARGVYMVRFISNTEVYTIKIILE